MSSAERRRPYSTLSVLVREVLFDLRAEVCQALADPKRLRIIAILRRGEMMVSALAFVALGGLWAGRVYRQPVPLGWI